MPIRGYTLMNISESVMEIMIDTRREYNLLSKEELVAMYNDGEQNGFQGMHMKVVYFVALHLAFMDAFNSSPFKVTEIYIGFTGPIVGNEKGTWDFVQVDHLNNQDL